MASLPSCEDDPRDAYFGTDAGADYRLPPLSDAGADGNPDQGDGASDTAADAAAEAAPATDLRQDTSPVDLGVDRPADAGDTSMSLDLAPTVDTADGASDLGSDLGGDSLNDATPG